MHSLQTACIIHVQAEQFSPMQSESGAMSASLPASVIEAVVCQESFGVFGWEGGVDQLTCSALGQTKFSVESHAVYVAM